ncbi:MAG: hypothetical protein ACE366_12280 [Bradymonadia bacterium]
MSDVEAHHERDVWLRICAGALAGALVGCLFYSLDRTRAAIDMGPVDPTAIMATVRVEYFWRLGLSAFISTVGAIAGWRLALGRAEQIIRWLTRLLVPVTLGCALLSVMYP